VDAVSFFNMIAVGICGFDFVVARGEEHGDVLNINTTINQDYTPTSKHLSVKLSSNRMTIKERKTKIQDFKRKIPQHSQSLPLLPPLQNNPHLSATIANQS
jgi:hypothetical protein